MGVIILMISNISHSFMKYKYLIYYLRSAIWRTITLLIAQMAELSPREDEVFIGSQWDTGP